MTNITQKIREKTPYTKIYLPFLFVLLLPFHRPRVLPSLRRLLLTHLSPRSPVSRSLPYILKWQLFTFISANDCLHPSRLLPPPPRFPLSIHFKTFQSYASHRKPCSLVTLESVQCFLLILFAGKDVSPYKCLPLRTILAKDVPATSLTTLTTSRGNNVFRFSLRYY